MNQIKPYSLWIGHAADAQTIQEVFAKGIKAVVQLAAEERPAPLPRELIYCRFPLVDGAGNDAELLQLAIGSLARLLRIHMPTLVSCGGGLSRSPAIAAAALATNGEGSLEECLRMVANYQRMDLSPALWADIERVFTSGSFGA